MNPLVLLPLGLVAWRDYANKGEVEESAAIVALVAFLFMADFTNIILTPLILVALYFMDKYGGQPIDGLVFSGMCLVIGIWAFVALMIAIEMVMLGVWKKRLTVGKGVAFLPYLFLGCLAVVAGSVIL